MDIGLQINTYTVQSSGKGKGERSYTGLLSTQRSNIAYQRACWKLKGPTVALHGLQYCTNHNKIADVGQHWCAQLALWKPCVCMDTYCCQRGWLLLTCLLRGSFHGQVSLASFRFRFRFPFPGAHCFPGDTLTDILGSMVTDQLEA